MDINTLLCNDENDVEMKDVNDASTNLPMLPELEQPQTTYESTNPILYSSMTNEDMPNMNSLTIDSPTSTPSTPPTPPSNIITSKLDSLSGIAAATAALRQRKHVRSSPRARKSVLSIGNSSGSPSNNHYPYTTTVGSSRHRLLAPVTPQPPPNHPISSAILRRNRIQNGIRSVVRGVSDTLFTHNNQNQNQNQSQQNTETSNTTESNSNSTSFSNQNIFANICNRNNMASSSQTSNQQSPLMSDNNLNQDDVNHGIKCCLQWLKYAITHLDQEINLLRNIANESFHVYCNNIQNYRNSNIENNNENSASNSDYYLNNQQEGTTSTNTNNNGNELPPFQNQLTNVHRKSLIEIKRDIVFTIRKTVEIIIKGASKYLPGESRLIIRRFILSLPSRLSKLTQRVKAPEAITSSSNTTATNANGKMDTDTSVISSPTSSYMTDETETLKMTKEDENPLNAINATKEESLKIMTLATEGNDMLKKMMDVFEKSFQENNKNNLDNINLINTNESSTINYNTSKMLYNNDKYNKLGNNNFNNPINNTNNNPVTTASNNTNYIMNYNEPINKSNNN